MKLDETEDLRSWNSLVNVLPDTCEFNDEFLFFNQVQVPTKGQC